MREIVQNSTVTGSAELVEATAEPLFVDDAVLVAASDLAALPELVFELFPPQPVKAVTAIAAQAKRLNNLFFIFILLKI